jgi:hypothetical protein
MIGFSGAIEFPFLSLAIAEVRQTVFDAAQGREVGWEERMELESSDQ